jgi:hypothetical protein
VCLNLRPAGGGGKRTERERFMTEHPPPRRFALDAWDGLLLLVLLLEFFAVSRLPFAAKPMGDLNFYLEAKALAAALKGSGPWADVAVSRGPAPVLYYTIPFLLVPAHAGEETFWRVGFYWNVLWMGVALLALRRAGAAVSGTLGGLGAACLVLASPFGVYYAFGISAEPPAYLAAAVLSQAWAARMARTHSAPMGVPWLAVLALGGLLLSRPNAVLVLPLLTLSALLLARHPRNAASVRALAWLVALTTVLVLAAPMALRLLPRTQPGSSQLENLSHVVLHGRFQYRTEPFDWRYWDDETRQGSADYAGWVHVSDSLEQAAEAAHTPVSPLRWQWIVKDLRDHPWVTFQCAAVRLLTLNLAFVNSKQPDAFRMGPISGPVAYWLFHAAVNLAWVTVLALALRSVVRRPRDLPLYGPLWAPWTALLLFHLFTYAEPRYLFPGQPGIVVLAAVALGPWLAARFPGLGVRRRRDAVWADVAGEPRVAS